MKIRYRVIIIFLSHGLLNAGKSKEYTQAQALSEFVARVNPLLLDDAPHRLDSFLKERFPHYFIGVRKDSKEFKHYLKKALAVTHWDYLIAQIKLASLEPLTSLQDVVICRSGYSLLLETMDELDVIPSQDEKELFLDFLKQEEHRLNRRY